MGLRMQSLPLDEGVLVATMNAISEGLWILQARRRQAAAAAGGAGGSTMSCSRCFVIRHHSWRGRHATTDVGSLRKSLLLRPLIRNRSSAYLIEIASSGFCTLLFVRPSSASCIIHVSLSINSLKKLAHGHERYARSRISFNVIRLWLANKSAI